MKADTDRHSYGEIENSELVERFLGLSAEDLISYNVKYHRNCYINLANKANLEAAKKRYDRGKTSRRLSDITHKKVGRRPSTLTPEMPNSTTENPITQRKFAASHNEELCAFCQEEKNVML